MSSAPPPPEEPKPPKPRRRWKRWVFGFLIVLAAFLIWANGPGLRWGAKKIISQQLEAQKLSGDFQVTGTALTGLSIRNLSLIGESKIQSVQSDLLKLKWSTSSLLKKQIEAITLDKLHVVIDPNAPALPEKEDEAHSPNDEDEKTLSEILNLVRGILTPSAISLTDLRVEVLETTTVTLASLTHPPGTDDYLITDLHTKDHLDRDVHNPATTITWTEPGFALDQITLLPQLSLQDIIFHPDQAASGKILIADNQISISSNLKASLHVSLDSPALDLASVAQIIKPDLTEAAGTITAFEVDTSKGLVNIQGNDLQWDEMKITSASIQASTPDLLSPLDQPVDVKVNLEDRLTINGTITPNVEALDSQAKLSFTFQDPAIPTVTGDLILENREARIDATALGDLRIIGTYFLDSSTYEAKATCNLQDASRLDPKLLGPLTFSLNSKGDLKQENHTGALDLGSLKLNQADLPDTTTTGRINYDWPGKITITDLKMTSPEGHIQANLEWQNNLLTISQLDLFEGTSKLLTATAKIPAPLNTKSLDDIINSTEPISLSINSKPLPLQKLAPYAPIPKELSGVFIADLNLTGSFAKPALNGFATLDSFRIDNQPDVPPLDLELTFKTEDEELLLTTLVSEPRGLLLNIDGKLPFLPRAWIENKTNPENSPIDLRITTPNLDLNRFTQSPSLPQELFGTLETDLTLSGTLTNPTLNGFLNLDDFRFGNQPDLPPFDLELNFKTENKELIFTNLVSEPRGPLLNIEGKIPFLPRVWIESKTNPDNSPIDLKIRSQKLDLSHFTKSNIIPDKPSGILQTNLILSGTLANPTLNGFLNLDDFRLNSQPDLPPLDLDLNFKTENQKLLLTARATEPDGPLLNIDGNLPFLPQAWIDRKKDPSQSPLNLRISSPDLNLSRVQPFVPTIQQITGSLKLDVLVGGTISEPTYSGSAKALISKMRLAKSPISDFRDTDLNVTLRGKVATIQPSQISAAGGTAQVSGTVNLEGDEPVFNIGLTGEHLLLHRTIDYIFRGNTALKLTGPLSDATVSGDLQITESLFYQDLEILPFGVPRTTEIPEPNLPSFSRAPSRNKNTEKEPSGFFDWKLNIAVTTLDPVLIRGNLAKGEITGNVLVTGTIDDPKTSGTLTAKELVADLPFSNLEVTSGVVTLRPESLTNPLIDLRGTSTVGQYTVQVYLNGPVQNPKLILTSDPPLPESEIMLLLATGSASAQLEDRQVASQKALQYLFEGLRRRNKGKDKTVLQRLLKNSDQIELSLGDTNQFSGRRFSSASLEISDQWDFTTQIDEDGQTRALIIFSVRFR